MSKNRYVFFIHKLSVYCGFYCLIFLTLNRSGKRKLIHKIQKTLFNFSLYHLLHMILSSPSRLRWFDYMQKSLSNMCNVWLQESPWSCCLSLFFMWSFFFYFYHLIFFLIVSSKLSLLRSVDAMVIYDLVEWQNYRFTWDGQVPAV